LWFAFLFSAHCLLLGKAHGFHELRGGWTFVLFPFCNGGTAAAGKKDQGGNEEHPSMLTCVKFHRVSFIDY
jgi:hypothetical protein